MTDPPLPPVSAIPNISTDLIVDISDLHCGSSLALCAPGVPLTANDAVTALNPWGKVLWPVWQSTIEEILIYCDGRPFTLILNGDIVDGVHHGTTELISHTPGDHVSIALACLEGIATEAESIYVIEGTECHTGSAEHAVGTALDAVRSPLGHGAWAGLVARWRGSILSAWHHRFIGSRKWTDVAALARAAVQERVQCLDAREPIPSIILRAHGHDGIEIRNSGSYLAVATPGWQFNSRWFRSKAPNSYPGLGAVILDMEGIEPGCLPRTHWIEWSHRGERMTYGEL